MLLYVVCKGKGYKDNPDQNWNVHMNVTISLNMSMSL